MLKIKSISVIFNEAVYYCAHHANRVTGWACEKIAQNVAQPIFVKFNT
jgi:hypothetical protein